MEHVMVQKIAQHVTKTVDIVPWNHPVGMVNVMAQKTVTHVGLTVALVTHFHQPVEMVYVTATRIAQTVLKIVAPI